jgi:sugar/nucleoside kinase (ribokinase family)
MTTADAERTMMTYVGAAAEMGPLSVAESDVAAASVVLMEGSETFLTLGSTHVLLRLIVRKSKFPFSVRLHDGWEIRNLIIPSTFFILDFIPS